MTAARRPVAEKSSSHCAVWTMRPPNVSMPGMSGIFGWHRKPVAAIRYCVLSVSPPASARRHSWASSSHRAPSTMVLNRMNRRTSYFSATFTA